MTLKALTILIALINPLACWTSLGQDSSIITAEANTASLMEKIEVQPHKLPVTQGYVQPVSQPDFLPIRDWSIKEPDINLKAGLVYDSYHDKVLWQKNDVDKLPIASLTKLMTAVIVVENMKLDRIVEITEEAYNYPGNMGDLKANERITVKNLLYALLMESSNDAAIALAQYFGEEEFINLMNKKAQEIGLKSTNYADPSGLHPENISTASDLVSLTKFTFEKPLIWSILKTHNITLRSADGQYDHHLQNNNKLLNRLAGVVGGKTGYTEEAGGCMMTAVKNPVGQGYLITIVLGAEDRMVAIEELILWTKKAYLW